MDTPHLWRFPRLPGTSLPLSPRLRELLVMLGRGLTNKEVAVVMSLTEYTVESYVRDISRAWDCERRVQLVIRALKENVLTLEDL